MGKTGPEIRHDAKERMKKYRVEMTAKGYISTTIFLSQEHREELKRLGEVHRLTRAEAAEHIFQIYNKNITQTHNTNTDQQTESSAIIESLEARLKSLEERGSNQAEVIEEPAPAIESQPDQGKEKFKQAEHQDIELPDYLIDVNPNMPIEERDKIILQLKEDFPSRSKAIAQKRIDMLNAAGILLNGKPWARTKQFSDQLNFARRRQENNES
ncbi:hypothetical protein [Desulfobacter postgatei]|jgi:uncharacterized coiled-coil protein SlyX|uniref:hypothetical protein n=1 Tax=Desulfobacter postgatei TaxID=2293 RepID=UPI002A35C2CC|nr:hypothetical protein [Desulfobacter postgatei]MDX9963960.1 hypothetical protein [Desulfobacter postgatei]